MVGTTNVAGSNPGPGSQFVNSLVPVQFDTTLNAFWIEGAAYSNNTSPSVYVPPAAANSNSASDVAIQNAVNSLSVLGGGTVYLGLGSYLLNNPVTMANGVSIIGVPTRQVPTTGLIGGAWSPSGGTIILAGAATQGFIWNATDAGSWTNPGLNQLSGLVIENLCFSGFTSQGIKFGAVNTDGLVMSRLRRLAFYQCGSQSATTYLSNTGALELRSFSEINVSEIYFGNCAGGGLFGYAAVPAATDQTGNSYFNDIIVDISNLGGSVANYSRPFVFGADPNNAQGVLNEIKSIGLAVYAFAGRSTISDTATFNGTTSITITTNAALFPVGMPVWFTASNASFATGQAYFVLSTSGGAGGTITLGNYRSGAAITGPGSGTLTIQQQGYPLLDLGGLNSTNQSLTAFSFLGLDLEGPGVGNIYCENISVGYLQILEVLSTPKIHVVVRSPTNQPYLSMASLNNNLILDADSNSAGGLYLFGGGRKAPSNLNTNVGGAGMYFDSTNNLWCLNIQSGNQINNLPDLFIRGPDASDFIYPNTPIGSHPRTINATASLIPQQSGFYVCDQTSGQTYTLPTLANASTRLSYVGMTFEFLVPTASSNNGLTATGTATVKGVNNTAGQWINNNGSLSANQVALTAGQYAKFVASLTTLGQTFWAVTTTGTIS